MQLDIRRQGLELDEEATTRLSRRVEFALGRIGQHIMRIWIHLADDGSGKRCRILVRLTHLPDVLVEDRDSDLNTLIDRAVNRSGLSVRRELSKRHQRMR